MSEATDQAATPDLIELPASGDAAFAALMDALAPEPDDQASTAGGAPAGAPAAGAGQSAPAAQGADAAAGAAGAQAGGDGGQQGVPAAGDAGGAGGADSAAGVAGVDGAGGDGESAGDAGAGTGPVDALTLAPRWGEVLTALEERTTKTYQADALEEVKAEFPRYFEALEQHPRLLVGQEVPRPDGKGMETLRDSSDAREWQEAIKAVLVAEIKDRASRKADEARPTLQVLHDAVGMLQNNPDLVPGTKQFDRELADRFVALAKPYEMRVDGKLYGYSIPVQPIITHLRAQLTTERAAKAAAAAAQPAQAAQAAQTAQAAQAAQAAPAAQTAQTAPAAPQAGIPSKAGAGAEPAEDFSTLFGTIGLPNLRV